MSPHHYMQVDIYIFINLSSFTCCIFLPILQSIPVVYGTLNWNKLLQAIPKNKHISFRKQINYNIDYHGFNVTSQQKKTYRSYYYVTTICHISFYFYAIGCRKWVKFLTHLLYTDKYHPSQVYPASTLSPRQSYQYSA